MTSHVAAWSTANLFFQFIRWKKLYAVYSMQNSKDLKTVLLDEISISYNITGKENCLLGLMKYTIYFDHMSYSTMFTFYSYLTQSHETQHNTMKFLRSHPLFSLAEKLIMEQGQQLSVWSVCTLICIISSDTWDLYKLLNLLTHARSDCTMMVRCDLFKIPSSNSNIISLNRRQPKNSTVSALSSFTSQGNFKFRQSTLVYLG